MTQKRDDVSWMPKRPGPVKSVRDFLDSGHADLAKKIGRKLVKKRKRK